MRPSSFSTYLAAVVLGCAAVGCAGAGGVSSELLDARALLDEARMAPGAYRAVAQMRDAEAAIAYAEFEERENPGHPLSQHRAQTALELAARAKHVSASAGGLPPANSPTVAGATSTPVAVGVR
jgi:hypothetical protein